MTTNRRLSHSHSTGNVSEKSQVQASTKDEKKEETASLSATPIRTTKSQSNEVAKSELNSPLTTAIITGTNVVRSSRKAFTEYEIVVTEDISSWIIRRRYRQFHALNEYLKSQYGSLVPRHFPPKKLSNNLSPHSIDKRHQLLQSWLQLVLKDKTMANDAKLRLFLTQDRKEVDFRPVMTRDRSGSEVKIQPSVENLGYLHQLKKGRWKRRWFVLRNGILYKYSSPKDKHPFRSYELRGAKASILGLTQIQSDHKIAKARKKSNVSAPTLIATAVVGKKEDKDMAKEVPNITIDSPRGSDRVGTSQSAPSASTPSSEKKVAFNLELHKTSSELDASSHEESDDSSADEDASSPPSASRGTLSAHLSSSSSLPKAPRSIFPFAVDSPHNGRLIFGCETESERTDWVSAIDKESECVETSPRRLSPGQSPRDRSASFTEGMNVPRLFGVSLSQIKEVDPDGAPLFISTLLDYIEATALHKEDLFTVAPDPQLKKQLEHGDEVDLTIIDNPHAVAGLVLEWLRELASPIIPTDFYDCFVSAFKISDATARYKIVQTIVSQLPDINRSLLFRLFKFLNVASAKKTLQKERLVKLFGRLIFRPKPEHEKGGLISSLTSQLIDHYEILRNVKRPTERKESKRRSDPKSERQSQSQPADPFDSTLKAQERLDRSINRLQQTLTRLRNQRAWSEAQSRQQSNAEGDHRLSDSDTHPPLERTDSFYISLITRLKNIDYDTVHGAIARAEGENVTLEHQATVTTRNQRTKSTAANETSGTTTAPLSAILDETEESTSDEFQRKHKEDKEMFDTVFAEFMEADQNEGGPETREVARHSPPKTNNNDNNRASTAEEDQNKKLFDELFSEGVESDSDSFEENVPSSQSKPNPTITTINNSNSGASSNSNIASESTALGSGSDNKRVGS